MMMVSSIQYDRERRLKEFTLRSPPCHDEDQARQLEVTPMCDFMRNISRNYEGIFKLMKFSKQSPTYWKSKEENEDVFGPIENSDSFHGFYPAKLEPEKFITANNF